MTPAAPKPRLLTLILLSALAVLPVSMFLPSLPGIASEFEVDYALVNLAVAGYAWVAAALQLVMGPLSDRFGRRPILLAALGTFTASSLGCALATGIWTFLAFRLLQAVVISGYSVSLAVIRDSWHEREAASLIGEGSREARRLAQAAREPRGQTRPGRSHGLLRSLLDLARARRSRS